MYYKLILFLKDTITSRNTDRNITDHNTQHENSELSDIDETKNNCEYEYFYSILCYIMITCYFI